jgi:uncharacterized membrane protein YfcA
LIPRRGLIPYPRIEMQLYINISVIVFLSGIIKGLSGFGAILIALPLLVLFIDIKAAVPLTVMLGTSASLFLLVKLSKDFEWREIYPIIVGSVPGILVGVFFLNALDRDILQLILGIFLISYSIYSLFFGSPRLILGRIWAYIFGFFAGWLGGTIGASGPPVIIYTSLQPWRKDKINVTLQGFFLISGFIIIFLYSCMGIIATTVLQFFGISLPMFGLGTYIGSHFYGIIGERLYRKIIFILLLFLGAFIISKTM